MRYFQRSKCAPASLAAGDATGLLSLEPRLLMSGDVRVNDAGDNLVLTGDKFDNEIQITQVGPDEFEIAGVNGTTIDGQSSIVRVVPGVFTIRLGSGNDIVRVTSAAFNRLSIETGTGDDLVEMGGVDANRLSLLGGKGRDTLYDLGDNAVARKITGFEIDRYSSSVGDSFALQNLSQFLGFTLRNERSFTLDETESTRFITDYQITRDARGRTRVTPVYSDIITGIIANLLPKVSQDRQQIEIEASITQVSLDSVNKLGINTPLGMRFIDQPVLSNFSYTGTLLLPNGSVFQPAESVRVEGPLASELSFVIQPTIVDDDPGIDQKDLEIDVNLASLHLSANSQSLRSNREQDRFDNFVSELNALTTSGREATVEHRIRRLLNSGLLSSRNRDGARVVNTVSSAFDTGSFIRLKPVVRLGSDTTDLDIEVFDSILGKVQSDSIATAIKKQAVQLPVVELLRSINRISLEDGQSHVLAESVNPMSRTLYDNMQVLIDSQIVSVGNTALSEIGIKFEPTSPSDDAQRKVSTSFASGGTGTLSVQTQRFVIGDFLSTFEIGGAGSLRTVLKPIVAGWEYAAGGTGVKGTRINGNSTFTETFLEDLDRSAFGTRFGQESIVTGLTRNETVTNKLPVFSDIPLIGGLFRNNETKVTSSLIVLVTPHIINVETTLD